MSLHAQQFFTSGFPHQLPGVVIGNSFYSQAPDSGHRLRIDFYETIMKHKYGGLRLSVLHPDRGKIDVVVLSFKEYGTFRARDAASGSTYDRDVVRAFPGGAEPPWYGGDFTFLVRAVHAYAGMWGFPAPDATARTPKPAASPVPAPSPARAR
ncbi:hypothetical protein ABZ714_28615 [Streptomyces sp. NPDC006798]|uniref:hypothetical protein n=1 Tax=Streptomyces sp. NPDC006798 TaxID=3155462 RepID=UPI0033D4AD1B